MEIVLKFVRTVKLEYDNRFTAAKTGDSGADLYALRFLREHD